MPKVAKQIIIILGLLLGVSVFFTLSTLSQKEALEQSKTKLENELKQYQGKEQQLNDENKKLGDQLKGAQETQDKLQKQLADLSGKINSLSSERDDWKTKVDGLKAERDQLIAKLDDLEKRAEEAKSAQVALPQQPVVPTEIAMPTTPIPEGQDKYWAEVLKEKASLEIKLGELQTQLSSGSVETGEYKKQISDLELELGQLKNEKEEITRKLKYSEDLANTLSIELAREKNDKRYVADRFDKVKEENLALRAQVKELTSMKIVLEKNMNKLSGDKDVVEKKLAETQSVIQNRIDEVMDIKTRLDKRLQSSSSSNTSKEVELPPIIVSAPSSSGSQESAGTKGSTAGYNGRVLSINPENNFVVVDIGEDAGIQVGDKLSVYRGSKYVAGLEVIQVRKDISAADIKQKGARIQVGDSVR